MSRPVDKLFPEAAKSKAARKCAFETMGCQDPEEPKPLTEADFRDDKSIREWRISGLCQHCQDDMFGVD